MDGRILKTFVMGLLVVFLMTLLGIYYVWQNYRLVQLGGDLATESRVLQSLQAEHELLEGQYHALRSNREVVMRAEARLKMKQPSSREIIVVEQKDMASTGASRRWQ